MSVKNSKGRIAFERTETTNSITSDSGEIVLLKNNSTPLTAVRKSTVGELTYSSDIIGETAIRKLSSSPISSSTGYSSIEVSADVLIIDDGVVNLDKITEIMITLSTVDGIAVITNLMSDGAVTLDANEGMFTSLFYPPIADFKISYSVTTSSGEVVLGTANNGDVISVARPNIELTQITYSQGRANKDVLRPGFYEEAGSRYWLFSSNAIIVYDINGAEVTPIFTIGSFYISSNVTLGIRHVYIDPNTNLGFIVFDGVRSDNKGYLYTYGVNLNTGEVVSLGGLTISSNYKYKYVVGYFDELALTYRLAYYASESVLARKNVIFDPVDGSVGYSGGPETFYTPLGITMLGLSSNRYQPTINTDVKILSTAVSDPSHNYVNSYILSEEARGLSTNLTREYVIVNYRRGQENAKITLDRANTVFTIPGLGSLPAEFTSLDGDTYNVDSVFGYTTIVAVNAKSGFTSGICDFTTLVNTSTQSICVWYVDVDKVVIKEVERIGNRVSYMQIDGSLALICYSGDSYIYSVTF